MTVRMKALRSFRGDPGEGNSGDDRMVDAGKEFNVAQSDRAAELERLGHAVPVAEQAPITPVAPHGVEIQKPSPQNKAVEQGPLPSVGGETGAESAPSSSDRAHPQRGSRSRKGKGGLDL